MEPIIPNSKSNRCLEPQSSSCVLWDQNIKIPCISSCVGDTVTDMISKLGNQLCFNESLTDLIGLNISCFYSPCPTCQQPNDIKDILQIYANYLCTIKTTINAINAQLLALGATPPPNI